MFRLSLRTALLTGAILAVTTISARAEDEASKDAPKPAAPATQKVCVQVWVPETYQCTRTVYKTECKEETYTAYKCVSEPVTKTRTCTTYKMVQETKMVERQVCECIPTVETKTVMQPCYSYQTVTKMVRKCEDHGHYECHEVPCGPTLCDRMKKCFHKNDCCYCEPCRTKTVKCWVPCKVWVECPVTCCQRVCTYKPVTHQVCSYKRVMKTVTCPVTCCKCIPETKTETYTCMVQKQVPYTATRTVSVCKPVTETVTCTRMVCRTVEKEVPVTTCCSTPCCPTTCCTTCCKPCCHESCCSSCSKHRCRR
jgi:hypothetical protein